ncbi:MAG: FG-GAP repeat domain-containing protein [Terriglobales bacterium]
MAVIAILSVTVLSVATVQAQQDPLFLPGVTYDSGGEDANGAVIADVNGDAIPDLVVANGPNTESGKVGVLLGNGDGTFKAPVAYDAWSWDDYSASPQAVAVADVNGDHKPDIIVANKFSYYWFSLMIGNGDGTFQPPVGVEKK